MNSSESPSVLQPPKPARKPRSVQVHGYALEDAYFWLRERENPEVIQYLNAENSYTQEMMKPHQAFIGAHQGNRSERACPAR